MICSTCGAPVPDNTDICPYCGAPMTRTRAPRAGEETQFAASSERAYSTAPVDQTEMAGTAPSAPAADGTEFAPEWMHRSQEERVRPAFEVPGSAAREPAPAPARPRREKRAKAPKAPKAPKTPKAKAPKADKPAGHSNLLRIALVVVLAVLVIALILR